VASEKSVSELEGIATTDPASGNPAYWIDPSQSAQATAAEYTTLAPVDVVLNHLAKVIRDRVDELLTREATRRLVDRVREQSPTIVDELIPDKLSLSEVQGVLQLLVRESVSIRNLATILEALGDHAKVTSDVELLAEHVRQRLGREIVARYSNADSVLEVLRPGALVVKALRTGPPESAWREFPEFVRSLSMRFDWAHQQAARPVLLVPSDVRSTIRQQALKSDRGIVVLGEAEVPRETQIRQLGEVIESQLIDG
jgi:flagellar biosynthesis protein FlhA